MRTRTRVLVTLLAILAAALLLVGQYPYVRFVDASPWTVPNWLLRQKHGRDGYYVPTTRFAVALGVEVVTALTWLIVVTRHRWRREVVGEIATLAVIYIIACFLCSKTIISRGGPAPELVPSNVIPLAMLLGTLAGYRVGHPIRGTCLALAAAGVGICLGEPLGRTEYPQWLLSILRRTFSGWRWLD